MANVLQDNQQQGHLRQQRIYPLRLWCTPLGKPIELVLEQLLQLKLTQLPPAKQYDPGQFKPS